MRARVERRPPTLALIARHSWPLEGGPLRAGKGDYSSLARIRATRRVSDGRSVELGDASFGEHQLQL